MDKKTSLPIILIILALVFCTTVKASDASDLDAIEKQTMRPKRSQFARVYFPTASTLQQGGKRYLVESSYYQKTGTFDANGELSAMNEGESYTGSDIQGVLYYGYSDSLQFGGGVRARMVNSQSATADVSNSGLESYFGRINYSLSPLQGWQFAALAEYRLTAYANTYAAAAQVPQGELVLGDDGAHMLFGGAATYRLSSTHYLNTAVYYSIPPAHLSQEVRYDVHSAWTYTRFAMLLGIEGVYSLQTDSFASDQVNRPQTSTGTSARFNSLNREWVAPYLGLNLAFSEYALNFKAAKIIAGRSYDEALEIGAALSWGVDGVTDDERKLMAFKEYLIEASVIKVSPRSKFIKIDKGITSDVEKGMEFDIYKSDYFGGNELVVSGTVYDLGADWAIIRINKQYKSMPIENGMTARGK